MLIVELFYYVLHYTNIEICVLFSRAFHYLFGIYIHYSYINSASLEADRDYYIVSV